ncbi:cullin-5-like [Halichondria panicea]|uniref:cullin-5-like n=1 Tax=Halichondria panicea TaxID=6063 RepID=UPI00312B6CDA
MSSSALLKGSGSTKFSDRWPGMQPVVLKLLKQEHVTRDEWQDLFWEVHSVCSWDEKASVKIQKSLETEILTFISDANKRVQLHEEESALLKAYINEWSKYFTQCGYLPKPFQAMEIEGASHKPKKKNQEGNRVQQLMLKGWNTHIFNNVREKLLSAAMKLLYAERSGEAFDSQLVVGVRESFVNLSTEVTNKLRIYQEHFERQYIDSTREFYKLHGSDYMTENGVQNYMRYADQKLTEEERRANRYLETRKGCSSVSQLMDACVEVLVKDHCDVIVAECPKLIAAYQVEKLSLMFGLMDRIPNGVEPMLTFLESYITQSGVDDMKASAEVITTDSEKYVEQLLALFNRFSRLASEAFRDDTRFLTSRDKAYKQVVNDTSVFRLDLPSARTRTGAGIKTHPESKCPELLANYCDMLLRKTPLSKKLTSEEVEGKLKDVLLVLKYVQNKDVFMRYHKTHLTRRLILETSADSEVEENMVEWLRDVGMPAEYVNKLARMFQDIKVSEDLNTEFKDSHRGTDSTVADMVSIKVLNAGAWSRSSERVPVSLPTELEDFIPDCEEFYKKKHNGRKLYWHHMMSNGVIVFQNAVGKYELEVTTFQMGVLFAWNQRQDDKISFESLRLATELPDAELRRTLWSLVAYPKIKRQVLVCEPEVKGAREFRDGTVFRVNQEFGLVKGGKLQKRGKINLIGRLQLTTEKAKEEDNDSIVALRVLRVQEAIVKIMKMRKKISNAALQTELVEILKNMFIPPKKMIKEQIEWLIEHKYMKRNDKDKNTFIYLA